MTTIIRAHAAHDFLALVPTLVGYQPSRSLLCVAFEGNRTAGVLRHDLPTDAPGREAVVAAVVGTLCRMSRADAVVPIVYADAAFADHGMPERELLADVVRRAEDAGFLVRDALCVAADGWGSLLDDALPPGGRALALIEESTVARHPEALRDPADSPAALVRIPPADPALAARIADVLASLRPAAPEPHEGDDGGGEAAPSMEALAALDPVIGDALDPFVAAELLARGDAGRRPEMLAWLVHLAACPPFRDALMLQVAFGAVVGELAFEAGGRAVDRGTGAGETEPTDEEGAETTDEFLARLLMGRAEARPDVGRVERAIETLAVAVANAPDPDRAGALCVLGWLAWAVGRGSSAGALIERALHADPRHTMAGLLHAYVGSGALPDWAFGPSVR
ncbi:DUF4192 family protein [Agromyces aurantiacus]|uniref:DUF4192 family protein n=1 Tax=Agromyces aurantiacus TaxID=165814 RepID=A0ABV9R8K7_9MICO|nr:DUF4192 family protein [Agromyces aurantiacus]MBM7504302.1 hypothetical protein [Agromyces aurantiacus]